MKFLPLILAGVWRKPVRTVLTALSIIVAFTLFGFLEGINATFRDAASGLRTDILHTFARYSSPLPYSHLATIETVPGVARVAPIGGFNGFFQDAFKQASGSATHPAQWFAMNPHLSVPAAQVEELLRTRTGAIVGDNLMEKYGWQVGDRIPLQSPTPRDDGSTVWTFDIVGTFANSSAETSAGYFIFNYEYFDTGRLLGTGTVSKFIVQVNSEKRTTEVQDAIDRAFGNSPAETRTFSEIEFLNYILAQIGNVSFIVRAIVAVTFFVLLFLTTNTMIQSVRERIPEFAVMKTIGFSDRGVLTLVVAESLAICATAGAIGLFLACFLYPLTINLDSGHPPLSVEVVAAGGVAALVVSILSALPGVWTLARTTIVQALAEQV